MSDFKFQYLKFKIYGTPDSEVETMFNDLAQRHTSFKRLKTSPHHLVIFKYLIYLYDRNSDIHRDFVRLEDRRKEAAKLSGLSKVADIPFLDSVYECHNAAVLDCIQTLLSQVYFDRDYREWQTLTKELDEYTSARWEKIEGTRKKKKGDPADAGGQNKSTIEALNLKSRLREDCQRIREILDELEIKIFGDNIDVKEIAHKARFLNPEAFSATLN